MVHLNSDVYNWWLCLMMYIRRFKFTMEYLLSSRRSKLGACFGILVCLYWLVWYFSVLRFPQEFVRTDQLYVCLEDRIKPFAKKLSESDAFLVRMDNINSPTMTFVGNGYIATSFQENALLVRQSGSLSKKIDSPVLITLDVHGYLSDESHILDVQDGVMYKMNCFKHENELCVSSGTMVYVHRIYTSLLIQNFRIFNPLNEDATVKVNKAAVREGNGVRIVRTIKLQQKNLPTDVQPRTVVYQVVSILIAEPKSQAADDDASFISLVVLFEPLFPDDLNAGAGETQSYSFITGARSSTNPIRVTKADLAHAGSDHGVIGKERTALEVFILAELKFALQYPESDLRKLHTASWNKLWLSGITLSYSYAPNTLNSAALNSTLYYLASTVPDELSYNVEGNRTLLDEYKQGFDKRLNCSPTDDLLYSVDHWYPVQSMNQLINLMSQWHDTLSSGSCAAFYEDGVHGVLQAVLWHFAHLRLQLEYATVALKAESLHRDLTLRRLQLHPPGVFVNLAIAIVPGEISLSSPHLMVVQLAVWRPKRPIPLNTMVEFQPPKKIIPLLFEPLEPQSVRKSNQVNEEDEESDLLVWLEKEAKSTSLFVCPAGCTTTPIEVKYGKTIVPFMVTTPPTVLLHLGTRNAASLKKLATDLTHTGVRAGPNPSHEIITMHRHGHAFGGLPWLFWISLGLLISLFHLFFCKIIYNELVRKSDTDTPWNLPMHESNLRAPQASAARAYIKAQLSSRRRQYKHSDDIP